MSLDSPFVSPWQPWQSVLIRMFVNIETSTTSELTPLLVPHYLYPTGSSCNTNWPFPPRLRHLWEIKMGTAVSFGKTRFALHLSQAGM